MNDRKQFLLVDGYALIYRSYFAFINRPIRDTDGRNVSAVFGFFRTLFALLKEYTPDYIAVAMDSPEPTFRHEMFPEYKANREKTPEDLHAQIPLVIKALEGAGVHTLSQKGLEADDLIATLSRCSAEAGIECLILSGDKDLMQLVNDSVYMIRPVKGNNVRFNPQGVLDHFGVRPDQIADYLSLIGDTSDNVPGVKGIGPKGAVKLLQEYQTLDSVYEHLDDIAKGTAKKLSEGREAAFLSKKLVVLQNSTQCESIDMNDLTIQHVDWSGAAPVFVDIQSTSLVEAVGGSRVAITESRQKKALERELRKKGETASVSKVDVESLKGPGKYVIVDSIAMLKRVLKQAETKGEAAFDIETDSIDAMHAVPAGFSISWESGTGYYIPIRAGGVEQLPADTVYTLLKQFLEDGKTRIIGQNFKYDYKVLKRWKDGITVQNLYFDTLIAAWLLDAAASGYSMDYLASRYLGYQTVKFDEVVPKGSLFPDIELDRASEYAAEDADITYRLYLLFASMLAVRGLDTLMRDTEMPLVSILAELEYTGMKILPDQLRDYGNELRDRLDVIHRKIFDECGHEFNINSTKQLQEVLFTERGLKPVKKTKTGYSTNIAVLEELARIDPVPGLILEHRSLEKLRNTYVDALPTSIHPQTGRIHTTFIQTGTATGRLSSKNPNLQNIPIRSDDGRRIREAFVPAEGCRFMSADYSQIELVVLAHFADDAGLKEAFASGVDIHKYTGSLIFGVDIDDVTADQRRISKTINFGVMYGMSAFRLSRELGIPLSDANMFIDAYFTRYAGVRKFIDTIIHEVEKTGRVRTLLGRERQIPAIKSKNRNERNGAERIAVNTPIQGTAADIMKMAMISIQNEMTKRKMVSRMVLQVHDELIFEVPDDEIDEMRELVGICMEQAASLRVPLKVSIEIGNSWGEMH